MKNKIVIFSNIKGGVGKTTLCALFASYLVERGYPVMAIDADLQASLYRHRKREKDVAPEAPIPWNVDLLDTANREQLERIMAKLKEVPGVVLIDCPGNLNDRNLEYIYKSADTAIIPISFDADTVDATGIFVKALKPCRRQTSCSCQTVSTRPRRNRRSCGKGHRPPSSWDWWGQSCRR